MSEGNLFKGRIICLCMQRKTVEDEIEMQTAKLSEILLGKMREPERSENIIRITKTILSLREFLND